MTIRGILQTPYLALTLLFISCDMPTDSHKNAEEKNQVWGACLNTEAKHAMQVRMEQKFPAAVHGMALAKDGQLYFSDSYPGEGKDSRVYVLAPPYTAAPTPLNITGSTVSGLLWQDDKLYVSVLGDNEIRAYSANYELLSSWKVQNPWNMAFDGTHIYAVTYQGHIVKLLSDGSIETLTTDLLMPFDIICAGDGNFWVSEQIGSNQQGRVVKVDKTGRIVTRVAVDFDNPEGLAMDRNGILYVADTGADRILAVHPDGTSCLLSDRHQLPIGMALTPDGQLLVNSNHNGGTLLSFGRD